MAKDSMILWGNVPVHPSYIEVFEQVSIGERRDLFETLSIELIVNAR
jgi:hypothetical protein